MAETENYILCAQSGKGENKMLSVLVVLLCFNCALSVCIMSEMINFRDVLAMLINLITEGEEDEEE